MLSAWPTPMGQPSGTTWGCSWWCRATSTAAVGGGLGDGIDDVVGHRVHPAPVAAGHRGVDAGRTRSPGRSRTRTGAAMDRPNAAAASSGASDPA